MSSSIAQEINGYHAAIKQSCHAERPQFPDGVVWKVCKTATTETPYIHVSCSHCQQVWSIENPETFTFKHCGGEEAVPADLAAKLVKLQIAAGTRQKPTIIQRITGETPSLVNAF